MGFQWLFIIVAIVQQELQLLREFIARLGPFNETEWSAFSALWEPLELGRKAVLTAPGSVESYLYFVLEGVQRIYYFDDQEREATLVFSYPPSFTGVVDSFMLQTPSRYYVETLTPSRLLRAPHHRFQEVMQEIPNMNQHITKAMYGAFSGLLERMVELQCFSSAEKIQRLLERSPQVLQLVPHKYLANYIGIDPATFSKILNHTRL